MSTACRSLRSAVPIEHLGWTVFAEQSRDEALRPVYASIARSVAAGAARASLLRSTASLLFARRMVRPIRELEARAREIGEGKLDQRIDVGTGDELERSARSSIAWRSGCRRSTRRRRRVSRSARASSRRQRGEDALPRRGEPRPAPADPCARAVRRPTARRSAVAPRRRRSLERIERSVDALEDLLEALLDLSKLDVGAVTPQPRPFALQPLLVAPRRRLRAARPKPRGSR